MLSVELITLNYPVTLSYQRSTKVSLKTSLLFICALFLSILPGAQLFLFLTFFYRFIIFLKSKNDICKYQRRPKWVSLVDQEVAKWACQWLFVVEHLVKYARAATFQMFFNVCKEGDVYLSMKIFYWDVEFSPFMMKSPLRKAVVVFLVVYASVSWCEDIPSETPSRTNSSIGWATWNMTLVPVENIKCLHGSLIHLKYFYTHLLWSQLSTLHCLIHFLAWTTQRGK